MMARSFTLPLLVGAWVSRVSRFPSLSVSALVIITCASSSSSALTIDARDLDGSSLYNFTDEVEAEGKGEEEAAEEGGPSLPLPFPTAALPNGRGGGIPLVGMGVGNLWQDLIVGVVGEGLRSDRNVRLFDTAHASHNEALVARAVVRGVEGLLREMDSDREGERDGDGDGETDSDGDVDPPPPPSRHKEGKVEVHIVTKVWYTHLGYERTRLSVRASMEALGEALDHDAVDLRVHVLLHWPRCDDDVPWMDCEGEEEELPEEVRLAGPRPHEDKENAWKASWKALEDMYLPENDDGEQYPALESIGVSNFPIEDMAALEGLVRVHPMILQANVWSVVFDPGLMDYCAEHDVHIQAYNVMHGIVEQREQAPNAFRLLQEIADELSAGEGEHGDDDDDDDDDTDISPPPDLTPAHVVLAWLIQSDISIVPRTAKLSHVNDNSAVTLTAIPQLDEEQRTTVRFAVEALLTGEDVDEEEEEANEEVDDVVYVTFHARADMDLFWSNPDGEEVQVDSLKEGESTVHNTFQGHTFVAVHPRDVSKRQTFTIQGSVGDHEEFHVEL